MSYLSMSIWQVHIHKATVWTGTGNWYFSAKRNEIFKDMPNVFGLADDILIVRYNVDGRDDDRTLETSNVDMPSRKV